MKSHLLALSLGVGAILLAAQAVQGQSMQRCGARDRIVEELASRYGETRQSIGLAAGNQVVEVFASMDTGTWTITVTTPEGKTCLIAAGQAFERLDEELTPALLGEPA